MKLSLSENAFWLSVRSTFRPASLMLVGRFGPLWKVIWGKPRRSAVRLGAGSSPSWRETSTAWNVLCRRELAAEFLALPSGGSAREVVNRVPSRVAYVVYPEAYVLMDMDTPEDYVRCLDAYRVRHARKP